MKSSINPQFLQSQWVININQIIHNPIFRKIIVFKIFAVRKKNKCKNNHSTGATHNHIRTCVDNSLEEKRAVGAIMIHSAGLCHDTPITFFWGVHGGGKNEVIFTINIYLIIQTVTRLTELVSPFHYVIFFLATMSWNTVTFFPSRPMGRGNAGLLLHQSTLKSHLYKCRRGREVSSKHISEMC